VSGETAAARASQRSLDEIATALRAQWRMIDSVTLRPRTEGPGLQANLRLDPIVVKGSLEQQGHPRTPDGLKRIEERRQAALEQCVEELNRRLPPVERIHSFSVSA
jgi:hypothetical protein